MREQRGTRLVVISTPDLVPGFALAGAETIPVESAAEAQQAFDRLLAEGESGVIAVDEGFLDLLDTSPLHARSVPVLVALPSGIAGAPSSRRARLADLMQRTIGYQISFAEPES